MGIVYSHGRHGWCETCADVVSDLVSMVWPKRKIVFLFSCISQGVLTVCVGSWFTLGRCACSLTSFRDRMCRVGALFFGSHL